MPFGIGKAFSDTVFDSIERARDRAARNPGGIKRERTYSTDLQEAYLRAAQADADRQNQRELALLGLDADAAKLAQDTEFRNRELDMRERFGSEDRGFARDKWGQQYDLDKTEEERRAAEAAAKIAGDQAEAQRKAEADAARAKRYEDRSAYEKGVLDVRRGENELGAKRIEADAEARQARMNAERARTTGEAIRSLNGAVKEALKPDANGQVSPERIRAYIGQIRSMESLWVADKGMPAGPIRQAVSRAIASLAGAAGIQGIGGPDEDEDLTGVNDFLDVGLGGDEDTPPRFGGR